MRNIAIGIVSVALLTLSCSSGTASSREEGDMKPASSIEAPAIVTVDSQGTESGKAVKLTKQDFLDKVMNYEKNQSDWVYEGDLPALIDFYADWCGPCRIASPVLEELAKEYEGKIYVYKIDTDKEKELASVFGIRSIPSFLFVPQEGRPTMSSGIAQTPEETKAMFKQMIDEILLGKTTESL